MMIQAQDLQPEFEAGNCSLEQEYKQYGFFKKKTVLVLKKTGRLKAVILVNRTDTGLNMSDLTNSIKMMVVDDSGLDKDTMISAAANIAAAFPGGDVPVLVHPVSYAESVGLDIEKKYNLWILKTNQSDKYFEHIDTLFKTHIKQEGNEE